METTNETGKGHGHPGHDRKVTITVDRIPKEILPGVYLIADLKERLGIDACRELDEVVCGEFKPLEEGTKIDIKGGEHFVSHVRCGGSS